MVAKILKHEVTKLYLKDIKPWKDNPRGITDDAMKGLRKSLEMFGYAQLLVVNKRNMELVSGHQRLKVLLDDGQVTADCLMVDLDDLAQQAMAISMNNQEIAGYFTDSIIHLLEYLRLSMPVEYIDLRLQKLREQLNDLEVEKMGKTLEDDIPATPETVITKPGDLWILGEHRLLCGSSTNPEDVLRLMDGHKAALFATDPPYCVNYTGKDRPGGGKDWSDKFKEIDIKDPRMFMVDWLGCGLNVVEKNAAIYIWHASSRDIMIKDILKKAEILVHQTIIWVKPCTVLTFSIYPWRHEPCFFGWQQGFKPFFRPSKKNIGTVWKIDLMRNGDPESPDYYSDIWELNWEGKSRSVDFEHPTVKPVEIFAIPIRVHTLPGDICYEPFCGSGSQMIASEKLNRRCFAMETEPVFCDVTIKRWEDFTGKKAVLEDKK